MYVNVSGDFNLLNTGAYFAEVEVSLHCPGSLIWISLSNKTLVIICSPSNLEAAEQVKTENNKIWDSPLAKAMREDDV